MPLAHVRVELVVAEEALATEMAQRVHPAFDLLARHRLLRAVRHGGEVQGEDVGRVERVFVREDFLVPDAYLAITFIGGGGDRQDLRVDI